VGVITAIISVAAFFLIKDKPSLVGFEDLKEETQLTWKETLEGLKKVLRNRQIWFPTLIYFFSLAP